MGSMMISVFVVVFVSWAAAEKILLISDDVETNLDAIGIANHWGYEAETHEAVTTDGWTLKLHRIPRGRNESEEQSEVTNRTVVILMHGVLCASDNWILNLPDQSPGFVFADAGFDVWMPNTRGNIYTSLANHTEKDKEFWRYTFDENARYDYDAIFDKIEEVTGQESFYYVGHSQGTVNLFAKLSEDPDFSRRLRKFFGLGPGTALPHIGGPLQAICKTTTWPIAHQLWDDIAYTRFGWDLFEHNFIHFLAEATCEVGLEQEYCATIFYVFGGVSQSTNVSRIPVYVTHIPAGMSTANVLHYCRNVEEDTFDYYKFPTAAENLAAYGSENPPTYNLSAIRDVDIHLYASTKDIITPLVDLQEYTIPRLDQSLIKELVIIENFTHMDFLWSLEVAERVILPIIDTINEDLASSK